MTLPNWGRSARVAVIFFIAPVIAPVIAAAIAAVIAASAVAAKDLGPAGPCDRFDKASGDWRACAAALPAASGPSDGDAALFYAGYWLAKNGRYQEALDTLGRTAVKNARVLTYIGFATRKLGRIGEAMAYYDEALAKDPGNVIARAYLGEAHLGRGDLAAAEAELAKVEAGCGRQCDAYRELAESIAGYLARHG